MCWTDFYAFDIKIFSAVTLWRLFHWLVQNFRDENRLILSKANLITLTQYFLPIFILAEVNKPMLCYYELYWKIIYNKLIVVKNPLFTLIKDQQNSTKLLLWEEDLWIRTKKCSWTQNVLLLLTDYFGSWKMYSKWTAHMPLYCCNRDSWKVTRFFILHVLRP